MDLYNMQDNLPTQLQLSWKDSLSGFRFKQFNSIINTYIQTIRNTCKYKTNGKLTAELNSNDFWEKLKRERLPDHEITNMKRIWDHAKPFVHLSSGQLLTVLENAVDPLEKVYRLAIEDLQFHLEKIKTATFLARLWYRVGHQRAIERTIAQIESNLSRINGLRQCVFQCLFSRCSAFKMQRAPRNIDDVLAGLQHKINKRGLSLHYAPTRQISSNLDDNMRLIIYDILHQAAFKPENELYDNIISPMLKQGKTAIKPNDILSAKLYHQHQFTQQIISRLKTPTAEFATIRLLPAILKDIASIIFRLRYLFYIGISLLATQYLIISTQIWLLSFITIATFNTISTALLCSLGLLPMWWLGIKSITHNIVIFANDAKRQEIISFLPPLETIEHFICTKLSINLIDIPHFDSHQLTQDAHYHLAQLENMQTQLKRPKLLEKWLRTREIDEAIKKLQEQILKQKEEIYLELKQLSSQIAQRIGDEIELLEKSMFKSTLTPILPYQQLIKLKHFIKSFGDNRALALFEQNANVVHNWLNKVENYRMPLEQCDMNNFNQPWGGHQVRKDRLKGWEAILKAFVSNSAKKNAINEINALLVQKSTLSLKRLQDNLNQLTEKDQQALLAKIQDHLFYTLQPECISNAALLSKRHKYLIAQWYQRYKKQIANAENAIHSLFINLTITRKKSIARLDNLQDDQLASYYELLDGADIYQATLNRKNLAKRKNLVRQYFEEYTGNSSLAYRLIRFVPKSDKKQMLVEVAKKRLLWILSTLEKETPSLTLFNDSDIELFHDYELLKQSEHFDFSSFVMQSTAFEAPWNSKMESFLAACKNAGLDTGKLLRLYSNNNIKIKPFILHQHKKSEVKSSITDGAKRRKLRA